MPMYRVAANFHGGLRLPSKLTAHAGDLVEVDEAFAAAAHLVPELAPLVPAPVDQPPAEPVLELPGELAAPIDAPPEPAPTPEQRRSKKQR